MFVMWKFYRNFYCCVKHRRGVFSEKSESGNFERFIYEGDIAESDH